MPSGFRFSLPGGTNVVICTLIYGTNTLTASFTVTVLVPPFVTTNRPSSAFWPTATPP